MEGPQKKKKKTKEDGASLGDRLAKLREEALGQVCFDAASITDVKKLEEVERALETWGVVFITDAVTDGSLESARRNLNDEIWDMFRFNLPPGTTKPEKIEEWNKFRNAANGFGNVSFSYINKQFTSANDTPFMDLGGEKVFLTTNTMWNVNLALLQDNLHTTAILLALTHVNGVVSADSVKYASNPKPKPKSMTKEALTTPHVDIYKDEIERCQAMIVVEESVKLGFVAGSHLLKKEICEVTGNDALLKSSMGFFGIKDKSACEAFSKGWIAAPPRSLVIWKSGVVHFEATSKKHKSAFVFDKWGDSPNQERLRFVVGVHKMVNLSRAEATTLAILGDRGVIPDMYRKINELCKKLYPNIVNRKSTLYLVPRKIGDEERNFIYEAVEAARNGEDRNMPLLKKHLMGVSQDIDELPFSKEDKHILKTKV